MHIRGQWTAAAALACVLASAAQAQPSEGLADLPLEDLLNIEITSVSRHSEPLLGAAAAVFVITDQDIARSGARSIAEVLRLVPGLFVARIGDINTHVVASRGFADRLSDKLEVVVDGRSIYTPLFSGVFWDTLDTFLPDIERIEVIRGPGATLWGTNAVNGVINIITKSAADTRGGRFYAGGGTEERSFAGLRQGVRAGGAADVRLYAKRFERDALKTPAGDDTFNVARMEQAGFRADLRSGADHAVTLAGDLYDGGREDIFEAPAAAGDVETSGGNVQARWQWRTGPASEVDVRVYYDHSKRFIPDIVFREARDIGDFAAQHRFALGERQTIVYGAGYRHSHDVTGAPPLVFIFVPSAETLHYYTAFVQDQIMLGASTELTLGSKFEHNDYTGWEIQPNIRLGSRLSDGMFAWAAVSRAARTPSRLDSDLATFSPALRFGNPEQDSEKLIAYEAGARFFGMRHVSADLALFYNDYDDLRSSEPGVPTARFGNGLEGRGVGGELALTWRPADTFEARLTYAHLDLRLRSKPDSGDTGTARGIEGTSPSHQAGLRLWWQPRADWDLAGFVRFVDELNPPNGRVPGYTELNLRTAWRPLPDLELALVGENLLDRQHGEFRTPVSFVETERSGLIELNWRWD